MNDNPNNPSTPLSGGRSLTSQGTFLAVLPRTAIWGMVVSGQDSTVVAVVISVILTGSIGNPRPVMMRHGKMIRLAPVSKTNFVCRIIFPLNSASKIIVSSCGLNLNLAMNSKSEYRAFFWDRACVKSGNVSAFF